PNETVAMLRGKAVDGLAHSGQPEAVQFLSQIALSAGTSGADRDTRLAAVRGLAESKSPAAAPALAQVLSAEATNDVALAGRAHAGLVVITGRDLPADPEQWNAVVQAGGVAPPPPNGPAAAIQRVIGTAAE
ncbi:MAG: HEAT repeat domain-containing protein, partial [Fimbriiglobus sp.]